MMYKEARKLSPAIQETEGDDLLVLRESNKKT